MKAQRETALRLSKISHTETIVAGVNGWKNSSKFRDLFYLNLIFFVFSNNNSSVHIVLAHDASFLHSLHMQATLPPNLNDFKGASTPVKFQCQNCKSTVIVPIAVHLCPPPPHHRCQVSLWSDRCTETSLCSALFHCGNTPLLSLRSGPHASFLCSSTALTLLKFFVTQPRVIFESRSCCTHSLSVKPHCLKSDQICCCCWSL